MTMFDYLFFNSVALILLVAAGIWGAVLIRALARRVNDVEEIRSATGHRLDCMIEFENEERARFGKRIGDVEHEQALHVQALDRQGDALQILTIRVGQLEEQFSAFGHVLEQHSQQLRGAPREIAILDEYEYTATGRKYKGSRVLDDGRCTRCHATRGTEDGTLCRTCHLYCHGPHDPAPKNWDCPRCHKQQDYPRKKGFSPHGVCRTCFLSQYIPAFDGPVFNAEAKDRIGKLLNELERRTYPYRGEEAHSGYCEGVIVTLQEVRRFVNGPDGFRNGG